MVGTLTVPQLFLRVKALAPEAIEPAVAIKVNIPGVVNFAQQFLDITDVIRISRTNEVIISDITGIPGGAEGRTDAVGKFFRAHPRLSGGLGNFIAMLIRTSKI